MGQDEHRYRFLHVSTDEVYGERGVADAPEPGHETRSALNPTNPYAATKVNPGRRWEMALGNGVGAGRFGGDVMCPRGSARAVTYPWMPGWWRRQRPRCWRCPTGTPSGCRC